MEKLIGMDEYNADLKITSKDNLLKYENNSLIAQGNYNLSYLFKKGPNNGNLWGDNKVFSRNLGNVVQLGWDSVLKAELQMNGTLKITDAKCVLSGKTEVNNLLKDNVTHILTRAVDTCTFLWLRKENVVVMAHFNYSKTDNFKSIINSFLNNAKTVCEGYISYCELKENDDISCCGSTENDNKYKKFLEQFNDTVYVYNRKTGECAHSSHFEVGIYPKGREIEMFGDITFFNESDVDNKLDIKEAESNYYEAKANFFYNSVKNPYFGGCCRI